MPSLGLSLLWLLFRTVSVLFIYPYRVQTSDGSSVAEPLKECCGRGTCQELPIP